MIIAVWGQNKTGKSTFALTYPGKVTVFDFDLGIERALYPRFKAKVEAGDVTVHKFIVPERLKGLKLDGCTKAWHDFESKFMEFCKDKNRTVASIDTGTQWYEAARFGYLEELQENKPRESLLPIEYSEVYARMRRVIQNARSHDKHLVITHYARDEYGVRLNPQTGVKEDYRTGALELDGYKHTEGQVDLVIYTYTKKVKLNGNEHEQLKPFGRITLSGLGLGLVDQEMMEPSWESLNNLIEMMNGG